MASIVQFRKNIAKISNQKYLEKALFDEIKRYENIFVNQQKQQLNEGVSFKGKIFGVYKPFERENTPRQPKIPGTPYNFEDTGGFFDNMTLEVFEDRAEFWSTDSKTPLLVTKYKDLFGLEPERFSEIFNRVIYPAFMLEIRKKLQL